jgi:hypothetical protein
VFLGGGDRGLVWGRKTGVSSGWEELPGVSFGGRGQDVGGGGRGQDVGAPCAEV